MKDECTTPQQLGDEQLETVSGGDFSIPGRPCRWNAKGYPTHWIDPDNNKRFHYRCRDCGSMLYEVGNGFLRCDRCMVFFFRNGARKMYLNF